jgi:HPt (histidine-containing phosphotransfer) domain-containing protein
LSAGDTNGAQRLAHSLKGSAGNIEANGLRHSAGLLEHACQAEPAEVDKLLMATLDALHPLVEGLAEALTAIDARLSGHGTGAKPAAAPRLGAADSPVPEMLRRLQADLIAGEGDALQTLAKIRPLFGASPLASRLDPVAAAIEGFDFDQAARLVESLVQDVVGVAAL